MSGRVSIYREIQVSYMSICNNYLVRSSCDKHNIIIIVAKQQLATSIKNHMNNYCLIN